MFAYFPSTDSTIEIRDHAVKDHQFFRYKARPDLVIKLTKDRLDPEPGRTSRACGIRLSQSKQPNRVRQFVNKKPWGFLRRSRRSTQALARWFRCLGETNLSSTINSQPSVVCSSRTLRLSQPHDSHMPVSPSPLSSRRCSPSPSANGYCVLRQGTQRSRQT